MSKQTPIRKSYHSATTGYASFVRKVLTILVIGLSMPTNLILSVFYRKNFGERYYSLGAAIVIALLLIMPVIGLIKLNAYLAMIISMSLFVIVFLVFAVKRRREFTAFTHNVDCDRYSYYEGDINMKIWDRIRKIFPKLSENRYVIRKYYEPALATIVGVILMVIFITLPVGIILTIAGILQYFRVVAQYSIGREFMLDKVDQIISDEEMMNSLFYENPPEKTRGFDFFAPRPSDPNLRKKVAELSRSEEYEEPVFAE